jgi:hypothetical protein
MWDVRRVALIAVTLALAAPAAGGTGSGLYGKVTRGPLTPVCVVEKPCYGPAAGVTLRFVRGGVVAGQTLTAKDGSYRLALRAGSYTVRTSPAPRIGRGLQPAAARVVAGTWSRQNFSLDTGIR